MLDAASLRALSYISKIAAYSGIAYFAVSTKIDSLKAINDNMGPWKVPAALMSTIEDLSHHPNSTIRSHYRFIALRKHVQGKEVLIDSSNDLLKRHGHHLHLHALATSVRSVESAIHCDRRAHTANKNHISSKTDRMRLKGGKICLMSDHKLNFSVHLAKALDEL